MEAGMAVDEAVYAREIAARKAAAVKWGPTVELRFRKVVFGPPVLQQYWVKLMPGPRVGEWRDVPVEAAE